MTKIDYFPIFGAELPKEHWVTIDLSEQNIDLDFPRTSEPAYLAQFVRSHLVDANSVAMGGYREKRATYRAAAHFSDAPPEKVRDLHLGIDLWVAAGTPIYAPLDGVVHSFQVNNLSFDYGPTIILEHIENGRVFYTLYGHLALNSLDGLQEGQKIARGEAFAFVGESSVNGGWPPHLHLQVMLDMYGLKGDFYGATCEQDQEQYFTNCPNPAFLLGF
ncbi:peptidoglycan DD-metalloendopeptidase family protein [Vibrio porteresiae]|uniref:Peptidoglycan DD-metalloendopeptidase family protein n=1 Tax=Vibrio porteresiae DSM 19223 TaxID=1123496 RepID=A0ABZ0QEZ0_9VIBR|nr:peptidoglycan DD-metalloendopeptidase family protein [Vibrio porteresiae]WPC75044.1 peptidoglycan DD-metalloendopeptidase family protein [Vibrio porteresiae DSM 19223]